MLLLGMPYTLEKDTIFNTDSFEKGDLVVKVSYYKLESAGLEGGFRSYSLMGAKKDERLMHVSALIRLAGLLVAPGPGGPAARTMRSGVTKLHYLSRDVHISILSCCYG